MPDCANSGRVVGGSKNPGVRGQRLQLLQPPGFLPATPGRVPARSHSPEPHELFRCFRAQYRNYAARGRDPFRQLVSCILSLRTQDPVTDAASERLFTALRTPEEFAVASAEAIAETIYPVGMYNRKGALLVDIAQHVIRDFGGETPSDLDALLSLPGVGRKTANLVRSFAFGLPAICVDTHVHRIANRWGLVRTTTPDDTERELRAILPQEYWIELNPYLVQHGQQICRPVKPRCTERPTPDTCPGGSRPPEPEAIHPGIESGASLA